MITRKFVLMDHDGAIDDFLAMMLLLTMPEVDLLGVVVTPADCYLQPALNVTRKILDLVGRQDIPVVASSVRGLNPFPPDFRRDCLIIDHFPLLNTRETIETPLGDISGQNFIIDTLQSSPEPVTLLVTGPLTTVAVALDRVPESSLNIREIVWMGGAIEVTGNVEKLFAPEHDGSAEWNAYWDPVAVKRVWESSIPIVLCPLDITNSVPITSEFIHKLAKQRQYPLSELAGSCYALAMPQNYYCWDVLATVYLTRPEFYQVRSIETQVIATGSAQGRIHKQKGGREILMMETVDPERFYAYLLERWGSSPDRLESF